jgi:hypothetical protein
MHMTWRGLFGWAILFAVACGAYQPPTVGACGDGTPLDEEECATGSYVVNDRCFPTRGAACGCLGCVDHRCVADEEDPANVSCKAE